MSIPVIQGSQGKMNKDNEPAYVTQGDYLDAKDVRFFTSDGQSTGSHENVDGNKFAFDLGSVAARSKKYRVDGISASSGTNTGWDAFGTPDSELLTNQQSYDPHVIEDLANPGNLYMTTGMNVWYYDAGANTWTDLSIATPTWLIDTTPSYSSAKIVMDPVTNFLACIYLKDFGSGLRYVIKEIDPSAGTPTWTSLTGSQGFEAAQGYTYGAISGYDFGAYFDARVFYDNSGDLYLYAVCVHNDTTQPITSPFYNNYRIPRVFRYNTGTLIWDDISGLGSSWPVPVEQSWANIFQYIPQNIRYNVGAPTQVGTTIYFPLCYLRQVQLAFWLSFPIVVGYNTATSSWSVFMDDVSNLYTAGGRGVLVSTSILPSFYGNNFKSWAEPSLAVDSLSNVHLSFSIQTDTNAGVFILCKNIAGVWSNLLTPLNGATLLSSFSYLKGRMSISIDTSGSVIGGAVDDIYISIPDSQQSNKLSVLKYSSGTLSFVGVQGISGATLDDQGANILIGSSGELFVCFSDYTNASSFSVPIGIPTVYKYVSGGSPDNEDFDFFYTSGVQIGSVNNITTVSGFISGLNALFPPSQYLVTTNTIQIGTGYSVEFTIDPLDQNSIPVFGFNYNVSNTGLFPIVLLEDSLSISDAGYLKVIGRSDLLDKLFILSTPNERVVENGAEINVILYSVGANGLDLFIDKSEDLSGYGYVSLSNTSSVSAFTGTHLISIDSVSDPAYDIITLVGYFPTISPAADIKIRGVVIGYGEIGVAIKDENNETWSYTRLIGSNQFAFSTQKQADLISEQNNRGYSLYFTDNFNPLRSFYYYGDFVQDGGFSYVNNLNKYTASELKSQIELQKAFSGAIIDYGGQGLGNLLCGNYRYTIRFTTKENVSTAWSPLSNPFTAYPVTADPYKVTGGSEEDNSFRSNILNIKWDAINLYDYIEIGYARFIPGGSTSGLFSLEQKIIAKIKLQVNLSSMVYEHTGDEANVVDITPGELSAIPFRIKRAKNIRSIDNRLVISNVDVGSYASRLDDVFETITYSLEKKAIPVAGTFSPGDLKQYSWLYASGNYPNTKTATIGEYMDPENVFYFTGYMHNERYRFYGVAEFLDGTLSDAYYLFDVKFDRSGPTANDPKRVNGLSDFNLNDPKSQATSGAAINGSMYVPYIRINIPSQLPYVDGTDPKNIIKRIHIYRENVKKRTIVSNGIGILGHGDFAGGGVGYGNSSTPYGVFNLTRVYASSSAEKFCPFPLIIDRYPDGSYSSPLYQILEFGIGGPPPGTTYYDIGSFNSGSLPSGTFKSWPPEARNLITFYSPDFSMTDYRIDSINEQSDFILNYGHYDNYYSGSHRNISTQVGSFGFGSFYLNTTTQSYGTQDPEQISLKLNIVDGPVKWVGYYDKWDINDLSLGLGSVKYTKEWVFNWMKADAFDVAFSYLCVPDGYVFLTSSGVTNFGVDTVTPGKDYGIYNLSYGKTLTALEQYGDQLFGMPVPTGAYLDLQDNTTQLSSTSHSVPANSIDVFGGDTFTGKAIMKYLHHIAGDSAGAWGDGFEYYCQSYINHQLRYNASDANPQTNYIWPIDFTNTQTSSNYRNWFSYYEEKNTYNSSYSDRNEVNVVPVYNERTYYDSKLPATIFYSEPKLQESTSDSYSYIKASNRKDLDITLGSINHHEVFNGELITFQDKAVVRQFFNTTAMFADASSQIILGDGGAVLSRKGMTLSTYGTVNKWSVIRGRSQGGNDVLYWFDAISKKIFRIGADGVVPISTRGDIDSFLAANTNFIQLFDKPAYGFGVHGVWDESNNEVVFTFRARKFIQEWVNGTRYSQGDVVFYNGSPEFYDWHQTGEFYVSNFNNNIFVPSESLGQWTHIPHDDTNYYNEFTLVYSEDKNGFTSFYTPMPKMYLPYKDRYLSPRPIEPESYVYEHNFGEPCVWYPLDQNDPVSDPTALKSQAYIEGVVNYNPELIKTAEAIAIDSDIQPALVEVRSEDHNTFMNSSDFTLAETMYRSPVKNDTQGGTVSPGSDTSRVYGRWFAVKFFMDFGVKQKMRSFVTKLRARNRMYNK